MVCTISMFAPRVDRLKKDKVNINISLTFSLDAVLRIKLITLYQIVYS